LDSVVAIVVILGAPSLALFASGERANLPLTAGIGPQPQLPNLTRFPTVNIAPAVGWRAQERPTPALTVVAFAAGLDHPRRRRLKPASSAVPAAAAAA
jgi:glucose/arabinose dehydrogenase